jgi:hypothetical protein
MYVLTLSATLAETFLILKTIQRDAIINANASSSKIIVILDRIKQK